MSTKTRTKSTARPKQTPKKGRPTPKRGRSGNPAKAAEQQAHAEASDQSPAKAAADRLAGRILNVAMAVIAAVVHVMGVLYVTAYTGDPSATLAAIGAAAGLTMLFVPAARRVRTWHRWVAVWALSVVVQPDFLIPVMVVAEAWVLHRFWVVEGPPRLPVGIAAMFDKTPAAGRR